MISSAPTDITLAMYDVAFERLSELYSESGHPFPGSAASFTLTNLHPDLVGKRGFFCAHARKRFVDAKHAVMLCFLWFVRWFIHKMWLCHRR